MDTICVIRLEKDQAEEMTDMLMKVGKLSHSHSHKVNVQTFQTFHLRLVDVMDQAQHFGGSANSVGGSSRYGDTGAEFREGLEATERERKSTYYVSCKHSYVYGLRCSVLSGSGKHCTN